MSTFVVRFLGDPTRGYRGTVKHIGTGEETGFSNLEELLGFFDQMNALLPRQWDEEACEPGPLAGRAATRIGRGSQEEQP